MDNDELKRISKFMSLVLRHRPEVAGLELDEAGWVAVESLLSGMRQANRPISPQLLESVVRDNDKQRFQLSADRTRIRATQGHSIDVSLGYEPFDPPELLFHGTPERFVGSIRREGLRKQKRHAVHLHGDAALALKVGGRRGKAVLLDIRATHMAKSGFVFFKTPNQVWLTERVPPEFIAFPE